MSRKWGRRAEDWRGRSFGLLSVEELVRHPVWRCRCDCGARVLRNVYRLVETVKQGSVSGCLDCSPPGRPRDLVKRAEAVAMRAAGLPYKVIANRLGVTVSRVGQILKSEGKVSNGG